jgi:hypothetical protein
MLRPQGQDIFSVTRTVIARAKAGAIPPPLWGNVTNIKNKMYLSSQNTHTYDGKYIHGLELSI